RARAVRICRFTRAHECRSFSSMKKYLALVIALLLTALPRAQGAFLSETNRPATTNAPAAKSTPGLEAAQALSTITGVAISPLLGVSAVGAWKYFKTPAERRGKLPWFAQPWFWGTGLFLVALVFLKDVIGTGMPPALKKPFDVAEAFENKISALLAAG